jgi:hypothetical protein
MAGIKVGGGIEEVEFFGNVDRVNGEIGSEYPAYYFAEQCRELNDEIDQAEFAIKNGHVAEKDKPNQMAILAKKKARRDEINASKPKLSGTLKDELASVTADIEAQVKENMYTYSQMERGADPSREFTRQFTPCIKLSGKAIAVAEKMGIPIAKGGMVTRNGASKIYKIAASLLDKDTDVESLRSTR